MEVTTGPLPDLTQFALRDSGDRSPPLGKSENVSKELKEKGLEGWYRYGDSNPGPVAENHVS
jgi:hypothetical protein